MNGLILHSGAAAATLPEVHAVVTPSATDSWFPIAHTDVIDLILSQVQGLGYTVRDSVHGLWHEGLRYFGLYELQNGHQHADYSMVLGIRNSHDKSFPAALALGSRVFVCDNLAFSGEITIARKHTRFIERDLPGLVGRAVAKLGEARHLQEKRIDAYKGFDFDAVFGDNGERTIHDFVIRSMDQGIIPNQRIAGVLQEWRKPSHEAFAPRTAWSLFNAFTETLKGVREFELAKRTTKLHGMLDLTVGLLTPAQDITGDAIDTEVVAR